MPIQPGQRKEAGAAAGSGLIPRCGSVAGRVLFRVPDWLHHVLAAGRILFKNSLEAYMDRYLRSKLEAVLQEHRLVSLITQLRGTRNQNLIGTRTSGPSLDAVLLVLTRLNQKLLLVFLGPDAVFCENHQERSPEEKLQRAKQTFDQMMSYLPGQRHLVNYRLPP